MYLNCITIQGLSPHKSLLHACVVTWDRCLQILILTIYFFCRTSWLRVWSTWRRCTRAATRTCRWRRPKIWTPSPRTWTRNEVGWSGPAAVACPTRPTTAAAAAAAAATLSPCSRTTRAAWDTRRRTRRCPAAAGSTSSSAAPPPPQTSLFFRVDGWLCVSPASSTIFDSVCPTHRGAASDAAAPHPLLWFVSRSAAFF